MDLKENLEQFEDITKKQTEILKNICTELRKEITIRFPYNKFFIEYSSEMIVVEVYNVADKKEFDEYYRELYNKYFKECDLYFNHHLVSVEDSQKYYKWINPTPTELIEELIKTETKFEFIRIDLDIKDTMGYRNANGQDWYKNCCYCAGYEIFVGEYECDEQKYMAVLHEIGHRYSQKTDRNQKLKETLCYNEIYAWKWAFENKKIKNLKKETVERCSKGLTSYFETICGMNDGKVGCPIELRELALKESLIK